MLVPRQIPRSGSAQRSGGAEMARRLLHHSGGRPGGGQRRPAVPQRLATGPGNSTAMGDLAQELYDDERHGWAAGSDRENGAR